jgi:mono/diheme cytochrome c family protein
MTTHPRLFGSIVALAVATAAVGCSGNQTHPTPTGIGGDGETIMPGPLCDSAASTGTGGATMVPGVPARGGFSQFPPQFGTTVTAAVPPPAISGGTLRILADGHTAVAADPDRDRVYVVDLTARSVTATITLDAGDEPGRVVADAAGRAHVALRHGGALVSIDTVSGALLQRRDVCAAPRGVAYDPATDVVHVACADGKLVSLPAAGGNSIRVVTLDRDLRDVVVDGPRLRVSRFLSAQLLTVEADGSVSGRVALPGFRATAARGGQLYTPSTAWQMAEMPDGSGVMMLHQRGVVDEVQPVVGGYGGGGDVCGGIVHPAVTMVASDGSIHSGPALAGMVLAVDMAIAPDGKRIAFVSAGNATNTFLGDPNSGPNMTRVFLSDTDSTTDDQVGCMPDGMHAPCSPGSTGFPGATSGSDPSAMTVTCGVPDKRVPQVVGQPIAVAFDGAGNVVVQSREPAMLAFADGTSVTLSTTSRADTGHLIFHSNAGGFLACASCHAEGNDDGRIWNFTCQGARRTQSLHAGGLRDTAPFHWDGQETDMTRLMVDVFEGRMSGPVLASDQIDVLMSWIDKQPRVPRAAPADAAAVERGRVLFNDAGHAGCATCHTGARFTNNATVDVGTGGAFQVPSLVGVGSRAPFMHNGAAKTLADRFNPKLGGDRHGNTANLTSNEIADLIAYMQSI